MPRINILGASGTGKTTLGRALAERLGCPGFDSDTYFHIPTDPPFQRQYPPEERLKLFLRDTEGSDDWVLSGSVISWGSEVDLDFSLVVFLYLPPAVRLERLRLRERERFGARLDPGGDMHDDHLEFLAWSERYDDGSAELNNIRIHEAWLAQQRSPVLRLDQAMTTEEQRTRILAELEESLGKSCRS